ncbi:thiol-disulfide oxidoreductase [Aquisphaera giovannonii]|uniref:Thiol-disulfide oxidoreductase n=1 Tax=Aquisphaera giovannonii TaxID=406548 RepID=A0A5B9VXN2_9BACT|nr:redoxin domain-containing protein [Aquisphaera giovannonii]QEH33136.1 thiol-disulfide oxidoreductase [Aquisphaera giovannonii]
MTWRRDEGASALRLARMAIVVSALAAWPAAMARGAALGGDPGGGSLPIDRGVGQRMGNFTLKDAATGRPVSLFGYAGKKAAVLVFMGTECPLAEVYAPRLKELNASYRSRGVVFLGIDPNAGDSAAAIAEQARKHGLEFPMLKDEGNVVADMAMAERTPEVVVLDGRAKIRYRGAIDDQYGEGTRKPEPSRRYLVDALDAMLAGKEVAVAASPVAGCLIDRVEPRPAKADRPRVRPAAPEILSGIREAAGEKSPDVGQVTFAAAGRIIRDKCQSCHRPGQVGPFPLEGYDDAKKHAAMIGEVVDNRRMPPWHADPRHGRFSNDRSLTPRERATLLAWVGQGARLGDPKEAPPPRAFPEGWSIGRPDAVLEMPEDYLVPAQGVLDYVRIRVPANFREDRWVQAAEAQPGDRAVVHHIIAYVVPPKGKDAKESRGDHEHLVAYAPGDLPSVYAPGTAKRIPAGSDFLFEIHYTPNGKARRDRSRVGLIFAKEPVTREARTIGIAEMNFLIPPGKDDVPVSSSLTLDRDARLLSFMPHMHLRGKDFRYTVTRPGRAPEVVLSVPAYDFGWQSVYTLAAPMELPAGTRIDCLAHYDNSVGNPSNPDPGKLVRWGDQTTDEMMIGYIDVDFPRGQSSGPGDGPREARAGGRAGVGRTLGALLRNREARNARPGGTKPSP